MSVVVSMEEVGPCRRQLTVEVPAQAVDAETQRVVAEYRRTARLPGFRKGKVPAELVRKKFDREIDQEVIDRLVPRYWRQAEAESKLDALLPPKVENVQLEPGAALTFTAVVDVRPEIQLADLSDVELPDPPVEPTAEEVDAALEDLRRHAADWVATERPAVHGDRVSGRLVRLEAGGADEGDGQEVRFEVGAAQVWEELTLAAVGGEPGGKQDFDRRGEDGETLRFRLELATVEERDLPALDDAFAAKLGEFDSLEALRTDLRARLGAAKRSERRRERERALLDEAVRRHPIGLPEGLVEREIEQMLQSYAEELSGRGVDLEGAKIDWQKLAGEIRPQAEKRIHARLLMDAAAALHDITVEPGELEATLARLARAEGSTTMALRQTLDRSGRLAELRAQLRREKALRRMLGEDAAGEAEAETEADPVDSS